MIAIIGCGPAGMAAAIMLHDAGLPVQLFEQFDRPSPVGSGLMLQPTGLAVLQQLGLRAECERLGQRIDRMRGQIAPAGKVVLDIRYAALDPQLYGIAIHRASLFDVLYKAILARRIPVITRTKVFDVVVCSKQAPGRTRVVYLLNEHGGKVSDPMSLVVDASGAKSTLLGKALLPVRRKPLDYGALWTTVLLNESPFETTCLEQRYQSARVMAGVLPCGRLPNQSSTLATLFWSIKASDYCAWRDTGLEQWKRTVCSHWPELESLVPQFIEPSQLTHATYSHHTLSKPYGDSIVFIGDAAHATSPQLGQGANMALLDGWALAQVIRNQNCQHKNKWSIVGPEYSHLRRSHVNFYQMASYWLTPFYQSDSLVLPWLRDTFFEPVSSLPGAAPLITRLGAGLMLSPIKKLGL